MRGEGRIQQIYGNEVIAFCPGRDRVGDSLPDRRWKPFRVHQAKGGGGEEVDGTLEVFPLLRRGKELLEVRFRRGRGGGVY